MSKIGSDGEKSCDARIDVSTVLPAVMFCCTCQVENTVQKWSNHPITRSRSVKLLLSIIKSTKRLFSHRHDEKKVYCETCQSLTCRICTLVLVLHKDNRIDEMVHRQAIREVLVCTQDVASKLIKAVDDDVMAEQVENSRKNITRIIYQTIEQLHRIVKDIIVRDGGHFIFHARQHC